jgi:excisionase family DNA binding protein
LEFVPASFCFSEVEYMEKILLAKDVAKWLNVNLQRVYELTRRGLLPHIKIGDRQYRYLQSAIETWLKAGGNQDEKAQVTRF